MISDCFEVSNGALDCKGPIVLKFNPRKSAVDYRPLFRSLFSHHEEKFGSPNYERISQIDIGEEYKFSLVDLIESFCVEYSPNDVGAFIEMNSDSNDFHAKALSSRLEKAQHSLPMAYAKFWPQHRAKFKIGGVNIPSQQFDSLLSRSKIGDRIDFKSEYKTTDTRRWYGKVKTRPVIGVDVYQENIVQAVKESFKGRAFLFCTQDAAAFPKSLHDIHIVSHYDLPIDNLRVVKIDQ